MLGSLPEKYFSTKDPKSLEAFLKECDVLVASLPDIPQTRYMLDAEKLCESSLNYRVVQLTMPALLKPHAVFVNVGRGSLVRSDDIIKALDAPNGLFYAALDVTDPEPLPDGHPLW